MALPLGELPVHAAEPGSVPGLRHRRGRRRRPAARQNPEGGDQAYGRDSRGDVRSAPDPPPERLRPGPTGGRVHDVRRRPALVRRRAPGPGADYPDPEAAAQATEPASRPGTGWPTDQVRPVSGPPLG